jgi:multidrug efflux pump subunit AcrA (membrane-fusion protein)
MSNIINFFKFIFSKIWLGIDFILKLAWRFIVPLALIGLILVPIVLTYFPAGKKADPILIAQVSKGNVTKKITVQGTTENSFTYDLPVYQDAQLKEVLVKAGDKVLAGQVLATLDFVTETKVRATTIENQIRGYQNDIANNNRALGDLQAVNSANYSQMTVAKQNRTTELNELNQKKADKINELNQKKEKYQREKDDFDRQIKELENFKDGTDAVKQYQDKIDADRLQLATYDNSNLNAQLQTQQNTVNTQISSAQTALTNTQNAKNTACSATPLVQSSCDAATIQVNIAQDALNTVNNSNSNFNTQINNNNNVNSINRNFLNNRINENQSRINTLGNARLYEPNKTTDLPITETAKTARLQQVITELRQDSTTRKTNIKQIDDTINDTLTPINEQILAKEKAIDELVQTQNVSTQTMDQTASNIEQRNATAATSLNNANLSLQDTIEDIQKQEKNRTITAKRDGVVGKVFNEQGLVVNSRANQFTVVSDKYRLKFTVSADSRSQLKNGLKVITDKYPKLENVVVTEANLVPDATTSTTGAVTAANTNANYTLYADLPPSIDYKYTQGETVNIDVIIDQAKDVFNIPSTAVDNGEVYVGVDPDFTKVKSNTLTKGVRNEISGGISSSSTTTELLPGQNRSSTSSVSTQDSQPTFKSAKKVKVKTGLDDSRSVQVLGGLKEGEYVFSIFPKTAKDKQLINAPIDGKEEIEVKNDGTSGIPDPE